MPELTHVLVHKAPEPSRCFCIVALLDKSLLQGEYLLPCMLPSDINFRDTMTPCVSIVLIDRYCERAFPALSFAVMTRLKETLAMGESLEW